MSDLDQLERELFPADHPVSFRDLRSASYWELSRTRAATASGRDSGSVDASILAVLAHVEICELCRERMSVIKASDPEWNDQIRGSVRDVALSVTMPENSAPGGLGPMALAGGAAVVAAAAIVALAVPTPPDPEKPRKQD